MQRVSCALFTFGHFFAQGIILPSEIHHSTTKRHHHLGARHVANASGQYHASFEEGRDGHPPNIFAVASELRSILAARSPEFSAGTVIGVLIISLCLLGFAACAVLDDYGFINPERQRQQDSRLSPGSRQGLRKAAAESLPIPEPFTPYSVDHGYTGVQSYNSSPIPSRGASSFNFQSFAFDPRVSGGLSGGQGIVPMSLTQHKPAPLCPELRLIGDSWYAFEFESMERTTGPISIYGRGRKLLLTAEIQKTVNRPSSVTLTMGDGRGPLLGSITDEGTGSLWVNDKRQRPYGELSSTGALAYSLRCGGIETLIFRTDVSTGQMVVLSPSDGTRLASAAKHHDITELPSLTDHLGIEVVAGMDPALTLLCIIGLMAFFS